MRSLENFEQTFLNVSVSSKVFGYSLKIMNDGRLENGQDYIHYQIGYGETVPGARGMTIDAENLLYTVTTVGIQVSDQLGRINFIIDKPLAGGVDVKFGGGQMDALYMSCDGKLFVRKSSIVIIGLLYQTLFMRQCQCLTHRMHLQFFVDFFNMVVNRKITDAHFIGHHFITESAGEIF